jgi:DNA polymerase elongation subunit (family B)
MEMLHYYKNNGVLPELFMKNNKYYLKNTKNTKYSNEIVSIEVLYNSYDDFVYDIETVDGTFNTGFPLIIKNTDSVFMSFKLTDPETGEKIVGKEALKHTIELAKEAGELATKFLKAPHDLEYEKTFMPFCLLSKKRYVGMLYEEDPEKCYRKSMGIVLKRRDNAPIVKDVYGGIIDILMKEQNLQKAIDFTKQCLKDITDEKYPLDKLIITKSLNGFYKNPQQIAHKVLADRMGKRDPGNKPNVGDRIPFVYIQTKGKKVLQGDKVEHPSYILENKIRPDYSFYITNQIMKPVTQVYSLVLEDIPEYKKKVKMFNMSLRTLKRKYGDDEEKYKTQEQKLRDEEVKKLLFDESLRKCKNIKEDQKELTVYFAKLTI